MSAIPRELARIAAQLVDDPAEAEAAAERALLRLEWRRRRGSKVCPACGEQLPASSFGPDARKRDGLRGSCRPCEAAQSRARRADA